MNTTPYRRGKFIHALGFIKREHAIHSLKLTFNVYLKIIAYPVLRSPVESALMVLNKGSRQRSRSSTLSFSSR
jgi:hypothetical protein